MFQGRVFIRPRLHLIKSVKGRYEIPGDKDKVLVGPAVPGFAVDGVTRMSRWKNAPTVARLSRVPGGSSPGRGRPDAVDPAVVRTGAVPGLGASIRSMRGTARWGSRTWPSPSAAVSATHERDQIVRGVYRHFCTMLMEILHTPRKINLTNWREHLVLVGHAPIMDQLFTGNRPMIFLTGHYGNWELAGYMFGMFGFPTVSVARPLDNAYLERFLRSFRERTGQMLIPKTGGFDQMVEVLQAQSRALVPGRPGCRAARAVTSTSSAGPPRPTRRSRSWRSSTRPRGGRRLAADRPGLPLRDPLRGRDRPGGAHRNGRRCPDSDPTVHPALERLIRQDPTQYLWLHRRWKHQPPTKKAGGGTKVASC